MLMERIIGAFTFKKGVYAEVEKDTSFTQTAWLIVAVVAFLNQLGANPETKLGGRLMGSIVGTIFAVAGFAAGAFVISWIGKALFKAEVTFEETVRTLGLAYVWNVIGFAGILSLISPSLSCLLAPVLVIATLATVVAWFIAAKEALDLDVVQTIITIVVGWIAVIIISTIGGIIAGLLGLGAAGIANMFG